MDSIYRCMDSILYREEFMFDVRIVSFSKNWKFSLEHAESCNIGILSIAGVLESIGKMNRSSIDIAIIPSKTTVAG